MAQNVAPPITDFCTEPNVAPDGAGVIRIYGGLTLQGTGDSSRGAPGACGVSADLLGNLQSTLAPLSPLLTILDAVAAIANVLVLLTEVVTNPFKIPKLLAAIPGLVAKVNKLLALVPVFPQGILSILEMALDILNFILTQLTCLVDTLKSIQGQIDALQSLTDQINQTDDAQIQASLQELLECGTTNIEANSASAMSAFGPLARILCTVRALVALLPGGKEIAGKIGIPDVGNVADLDTVIVAVSAARDVVSVAVELITILGAGFGLQLPEINFTCPPIDTVFNSEPAERLPTPVVDALLDTAFAPLSTIAARLPTDADVPMVLQGGGFTTGSQVFFGTVQVPEVQYGGESRLIAMVPSGLLTVPGKFYIAVSNVPASSDTPFSGLSESAGGDADTGVLVSNQVEIEVT